MRWQRPAKRLTANADAGDQSEGFAVWGEVAVPNHHAKEQERRDSE